MTNMKLIGKNGLSRWLEIYTAVLLVLIPVLVLTLPFTITWITDRPHGDPYYVRYLVILAYSGAMAELIFWQARRILSNVNHNRVFSADTVHRMRVMAVECMVLAVCYLATMFWMSKFFMAALFVVFVLAGGVLLVFSELFRQANAYKEENDMTI